MKKILSMLLMILMTVSLAACGSTGSDSQPAWMNEQDPSEASSVPDSEGTEEEEILVVFYSASGNTGRVAELIADELDADTFEIVPVEVYSDEDLNWRNPDSRVCKEHDDPSLQDIELVSAKVPDWSEYDVVLFGYPIWWLEASWVVNRFITGNDFTGKTVIPFCTSSSSGLGESGSSLEKMAGSGTWLEGMRFNETPDEDSVRKWVRGLDLE